MTFEQEPTPYLPSLVSAELKVRSGNYRQGHRDASDPGSQSKASMSPRLLSLQTLLVPSSATLNKVYAMQG